MRLSLQSLEMSRAAGLESLDIRKVDQTFSRISRFYGKLQKKFATKFWHVQTYATKLWCVQTFATYGDHFYDSSLDFWDFMSRLSKFKPSVQFGSRSAWGATHGASFATNVETARPRKNIAKKYPDRWRRRDRETISRDFCDRGGDGVILRRKVQLCDPQRNIATHDATFTYVQTLTT